MNVGIKTKVKKWKKIIESTIQKLKEEGKDVKYITKIKGVEEKEIKELITEN